MCVRDTGIDVGPSNEATLVKVDPDELSLEKPKKDTKWTITKQFIDKKRTRNTNTQDHKNEVPAVSFFEPPVDITQHVC